MLRSMAKNLDYCGAGALLDPDRALQLDDRRWAVQPKIDGVYARASLDGAGRIARVLGQNGVAIAAAAELLGIEAGPPDSVFHGELEAHTEAGLRAAAARGWAALHLFDATRVGGVEVGGLAYEERYGLLHRAQALLECGGVGRVRSWRLDAAGDAHDQRGRYCAAVPRDLRRLPIVPLVRGAAARAELWRDHVERGGGEGLVAVRLDAPAGSRGGKRKVKAIETLDATVIRCGTRAMRVTWRGLAWSMPGTAPVGSVVEVAHNGWYENSATPKFARLVRRRPDKAPTRRAA